MRAIGGCPTAKCRSLPFFSISCSNNASMRAMCSLSSAVAAEQLAGARHHLLAEVHATFRRGGCLLGLGLRRCTRLGARGAAADGELELLHRLGILARDLQRREPGAHQLGQRIVEPNDAETLAALLQTGDLKRAVLADQVPEWRIAG